MSINIELQKKKPNIIFLVQLFFTLACTHLKHHNCVSEELRTGSLSVESIG